MPADAALGLYGGAKAVHLCGEFGLEARPDQGGAGYGCG